MKIIDNKLLVCRAAVDGSCEKIRHNGSLGCYMHGGPHNYDDFCLDAGRKGYGTGRCLTSPCISITQGARYEKGLKDKLAKRHKKHSPKNTTRSSSKESSN